MDGVLWLRHAVGVLWDALSASDSGFKTPLTAQNAGMLSLG